MCECSNNIIFTKLAHPRTCESNLSHLLIVDILPVSCQQLWFISPSKIGLFIDRWIKKQLSAGNCWHIHPRLRYLFSSYCIFWDQQTAWNSWPRTARNDWNRFGSCFCFSCNSLCYSISHWRSG